MDTVPEMPPGTFCFIAKRSGGVAVDSHVFIKIGGGTSCSPAWSPWITVPARSRSGTRTRTPGSRTAAPSGPLPLADVEGLVIGSFKPNTGDGGR